MSVITKDNLPTILGILISAQGVYMAREVFKNFRLWRKGASARERQVTQYTVNALERCNDELVEVQEERDHYHRQVGRRDHIILSHGLEIPHDGRREGRPAQPRDGA